MGGLPLTEIPTHEEKNAFCECLWFAVAGTRVVYHRRSYPSDHIIWLPEFETEVSSLPSNIFHSFLEHWQEISKRLGFLDIDGYRGEVSKPGFKN